MLLVDFDVSLAMIERDWKLELGHYNAPGYSNMADVLEARADNSELSLSIYIIYIYIYGTLTPSHKSGKK